MLNLKEILTCIRIINIYYFHYFTIKNRNKFLTSSLLLKMILLYKSSHNGKE